MSDDHTVVEIRNFLGEKFTRSVHMHKGVTCKPTGTKDEIMVEGNDLEKVSLSGEVMRLLNCLSCTVLNIINRCVVTLKLNCDCQILGI